MKTLIVKPHPFPSYQPLTFHLARLPRSYTSCYTTLPPIAIQVIHMV